VAEKSAEVGEPVAFAASNPNGEQLALPKWILHDYLLAGVKYPG